MGLKKLLDIRK